MLQTVVAEATTSASAGDFWAFCSTLSQVLKYTLPLLAFKFACVNTVFLLILFLVNKHWVYFWERVRQAKKKKPHKASRLLFCKEWDILASSWD